MNANVAVSMRNNSLKDCLSSIVEPKNEILSRLQEQLFGGTKKVVSGYSRMHNRHNRS